MHRPSSLHMTIIVCHHFALSFVPFRLPLQRPCHSPLTGITILIWHCWQVLHRLCCSIDHFVSAISIHRKGGGRGQAFSGGSISLGRHHNVLTLGVLPLFGLFSKFRFNVWLVLPLWIRSHQQ